MSKILNSRTIPEQAWKTDFFKYISSTEKIQNNSRILRIGHPEARYMEWHVSSQLLFFIPQLRVPQVILKMLHQSQSYKKLFLGLKLSLQAFTMVFYIKKLSFQVNSKVMSATLEHITTFKQQQLFCVQGVSQEGKKYAISMNWEIKHSCGSRHTVSTSISSVGDHKAKPLESLQ